MALFSLDLAAMCFQLSPRNCTVLPSNGLTSHNLNAALKTKESYQYSADSIMKYYRTNNKIYHYNYICMLFAFDQ